MADIPSQISFEQMLSHLFPGLFLAITIFMLLDTWSSINLTAIVLKDINALIAFAGLLFIAGTILGVIIDAFHHDILEPYYFDRLENKVGPLAKERKKYLDQCICYNDIMQYFEELNCGKKYLFSWEKIKGKDDKSIKRLKNVLARLLSKEWIKNAKIDENNSKGNIIKISNERETLELALSNDNKSVNITENNKQLKILYVDSNDNMKKIYELPCEKWNYCKFYYPKDFSPTKIYYFFNIEEGKMDDYIAIYEHLRRSIFHYYEFYINTFTCMIPFTLIAPMYIHNELGINKLPSLGIAISLSILTYSCLYFSYMSRKGYIAALYFAYCSCRRQHVL